MNRLEPIRVLFLGCGAATRMHSDTLRRMPGVELSYASNTPNRAREYCVQFGGVKFWDSYDAGLSDPRVTVAFVVTPTSGHFELALRALQAGKHVIVEKPAFLTVAEAEMVRIAAINEQREVFVAENYVYKPLATSLRNIIGSGDLGDVRFVSLNATRFQRVHGWRGDPALSGGGALFEGGVHWVSFAARIGLDVAGVHAWRAGREGESDRSSLVVFNYSNGAVGTLAHSWELRGLLGGARLSKVQGTSGAVTFESNGFAWASTGRRRTVRLQFSDPLGYRAMLTDFVTALRTGSQAYYTLALALDDLALLERAQEDLRVQDGSCETGYPELPLATEAGERQVRRSGSRSSRFRERYSAGRR